MMSNIVDGQLIADEMILAMQEVLSRCDSIPAMGVLVVGENQVTNSYVRKKQDCAERLGVPFFKHTLPSDIDQDSLEQELISFAQKVDGLVVQLPLPEHINAEQILSLIPQEKDVDVLNPVHQTDGVIGPVAGAVMAVLDYHKVDLDTKQVVVVGRGRLVGQPVIQVLESRGISPQVVSIDTSEQDMRSTIDQADVIISGVGQPGLITLDMVQEGVVLIDAGTSSSGGTVVGDIDPACARKASLFSTTPGGIGPVTIAQLYANVVNLYTQ